MFLLLSCKDFLYILDFDYLPDMWFRNRLPLIVSLIFSWAVLNLFNKMLMSLCTKVYIVAQLVKSLPACGRPGFDSWVGKIPWRREWLPTPVFWPGEFQRLYSPWGRTKSQTWLSSFHFHLWVFVQNNVMPPVLIFFFLIGLQSLLRFHINFKIVFFYFC